MLTYSCMRTGGVVTSTTVAALTLGLVLLAGGTPARGADHLDAPALQNPAVTGPVDVNDIYLFAGTGEGSTVMVMTVNPGAGVLSPTIFNANTSYEFRIDTDGDAVANLIYQFQFFANRRRPDNQRVIVRLIDTSTPFGSRGIGLVRGVGRAGRPFRLRDGGRAQAGLFDDPFFFDLVGFQNGLAFTGDDFFAGLNVSAIVLELPDTAITGESNNISLWCRTTSRAQGQVDRMGRPAINTVLISSSMKDGFNLGLPVNDPSAFGATVINTLTSPPFSRDDATAASLTSVLLPDVLTFEVGNTSGFLNGRRLADDVIDAELQLLTGDGMATDGVDANDRAFPPGFPYLAPPHTGAPE